jgi:Peptidase family S41
MKRSSWVSLIPLVVVFGIVAVARPATAGDFDDRGNFVPGDAVFVQSFEDFDPSRDGFVPEDAPAACLGEQRSKVVAGDALWGKAHYFVDPNIQAGCAERILVDVPGVQASYSARLWMRHGAIDAQLTVIYPDDRGLGPQTAELAVTGRSTSDGWIEMASNPLPIDGAQAERVYLRIFDFDSEGSDVDAIEIFEDDVPFWSAKPCAGIGDPVCGEESVCHHNTCDLERTRFPTLPDEPLRNDMIDVFQSMLQVFFGGRKTRLEDLPTALAKLDELRGAESALAFWNGWGHAIRLLHDWHTSAARGGWNIVPRARLNVCFFEGDGDASALAWPNHPQYRDILVSHTGNEGTHGIARGDRLVAVDGKHPIEWALSHRANDWGWFQASDNDVYADVAERMRDLILEFATSFTLIHCDATAGACDPLAATYLTADLPSDSGSQVVCDNRPFYHFAEAQNPPANHDVGSSFYKGLVVDAPPADQIHALVWNTLYSGGDPDSFVNSSIKNAYAEFKQSARGVVLDHRTGNGGTLDAAETVTTLVRPPEVVLVFYSPMQVAGFDGPATAEEGIALFELWDYQAGMLAGDPNYDPDMPVALLLHRDGSASDFMAFAMKGMPKVRLFGPAPTVGAFSSYHDLANGGMLVRLASGDAISKDGQALLGHGVVPDEIVLPKQSDLLAGKDTIHEAAVAWLQTELKP